MTDIVENAKGAAERYKEYHVQAHELLKGISAGLKAHKAASKQSGLHWGHVGDMNHYKRQLEELHDQLHQRGEYAERANEAVAPQDTPQTVVREELTPVQKILLKKLVEAKDDEDDDEPKGKDTGREADQHIHVRLKQAADADEKGGSHITFDNGEKHFVKHTVAGTVLHALEKIKPANRDEIHKHIAKSHENLMQVHAMAKGK